MMREMFLVALLLMLVAMPASAQGEKIKVVSTLQIFSSIVEKIGGKYVESAYVVPSGTDIHDYSLTQKDVNTIQSSDVVVLANSNFFSIDSKIKSVATGKTVVDFPAYNATIFSVGGIKHDYHGFWLYPKNAVSIARAVAGALAARMPQNKEYFMANLNNFIEEVNESYARAKRMVNDTGMTGRGVVLAVPGVLYVVKALGLRVDGLLTEGPNQFISSQKLEELKSMIQSGEISAIVNVRNMGESRAGQIARELSKQTGVKIAYVDIFSGSDYPFLLEKDAAILSAVPFVESAHGSECDYTPYLISLIGMAGIAAVVAYMAYVYRRELLK